MTKILVTGRKGQVGWELARTLMPLGEVVAWDVEDVDFTDDAALAAAVAAVAPDVIVNPAAFTAVDRAETELALAQRINGAAPATLAAAARARGALMVHYSTDYVYDGAKRAPYVESDPTGPLGAYGRTKLAGDEAVAASGADHLILRTSWVYAARGANFLRTILRLAGEREELRIVADQIGAPTWARFIAETTAQVVAAALAERRTGRFESGVFHLVAGGETSWHGFAEAVLREAARHPAAPPLRVRAVHPIATAEYPLPAPRPANSCLSTERLQRRFGVHIPSWETGLRLCVEELFGAAPPPGR